MNTGSYTDADCDGTRLPSERTIPMNGLGVIYRSSGRTAVPTGSRFWIKATVPDVMGREFRSVHGPYEATGPTLELGVGNVDAEQPDATGVFNLLYPVSVAQAAGGKFDFKVMGSDDKVYEENRYKGAERGSTVRITGTPDTGYDVGTVKVTYSTSTGKVEDHLALNPDTGCHEWKMQPFGATISGTFEKHKPFQLDISAAGDATAYKYYDSFQAAADRACELGGVRVLTILDMTEVKTETASGSEYTWRDDASKGVVVQSKAGKPPLELVVNAGKRASDPITTTIKRTSEYTGPFFTVQGGAKLVLEAAVGCALVLDGGNPLSCPR